MTKEQYFSLKEGDVLQEATTGKEVFVAIDMLGIGTPEDVPIGYVIVAYRDKLYGNDYTDIRRDELQKWEHTNKNIKPDRGNIFSSYIIINFFCKLTRF